MKKLIWLVLVLIGLSTAVYFLQSDDKVSTSIDLSDRLFAYENVDDIGKIELTRPGAPSQTFEKKKGSWYVNDLLVSDYKIVTLLKAITSIRVEHLPSVDATEFISTSMKKNGIHVSVYNKAGKKVRGYTVGPDATNDRCTYVQMDGKKQAYCLNISGFGSIRTRFAQQVEEWRDVALYRVPANEVASVKVEYHKDYLSSFLITKKGNSYDVEDIGGKTTGRSIDQQKVRDYITSFEELNGEGYENEYVLKDSIRQLLPFATIALTKTDGTSKSMKLFPVAELIDPNDRVTDVNDALQQERYFVDLSDGEFMLAQQRLLKPVLRPFDYFLVE